MGATGSKLTSTWPTLYRKIVWQSDELRVLLAQPYLETYCKFFLCKLREGNLHGGKQS